MLAAQNILNPKDGKPVVTPSQDMVLGNYYLTLERKDAVNTGAIFNNTNEVLKAYANGFVHLHPELVYMQVHSIIQHLLKNKTKRFLLRQ